MKRLCFIILCGLILYSCSKDETVTNYLESNKGNTLMILLKRVLLQEPASLTRRMSV